MAILADVCVVQSQENTFWRRRHSPANDVVKILWSDERPSRRFHAADLVPELFVVNSEVILSETIIDHKERARNDAVIHQDQTAFGGNVRRRRGRDVKKETDSQNDKQGCKNSSLQSVHHQPKSFARGHAWSKARL